MNLFSSERKMHYLRWVLTIGWCATIASLFYDPWTAALTTPDHPWSPLRLPDTCVELQGKCLVQQPYPLGATMFWGAIVPAGIFILLVFGHEVWRRICPLSFLSQIPRALGRQRQFKRENPQTGKVKMELAKIGADSWLGQNYLFVQFSWLFIGLCGRILFFNGDRLVLALWLILTIVAAILVGYLYGGKSWCQYFCPMAPVQKVYSEPGGLFSTKAHAIDSAITQSMCRVVLPDGKEQSACVACQNPCIDIDAERAYWDGLKRSNESFIRYGYAGLVVGYFVYYYLYAGNWDYYFSGAWARQTDQLGTLLDTGFYIFGRAIDIPKIVAVPMTLGLFTAIGYSTGMWLEKRIKGDNLKNNRTSDLQIIRHRIFTILTFIIFNFFFIFGGRPLIQLLPLWIEYTYELGLVLLSTLWLYKTWRRSPDLYAREGLASRFRKQLAKMQIDVSQFLEGRTITDLNVHEVYVLAKVLPGFTTEKRYQAYKGVVKDSLEEGYVNYSSSLEILKQLRQELGITEDEHREILNELGVESPELLDPHRQRNLENLVRLNGYRKSLERLLTLQSRKAASESIEIGELQPSEMSTLRQLYAITPQEEQWIIEGLDPQVSSIRRYEFLLAQLADRIIAYRAVNQPILSAYTAVTNLLRETIQHKKELTIVQMLEILAQITDESTAVGLAESLAAQSPQVLVDILSAQDWQSRLSPTVYARLKQPSLSAPSCSIDLDAAEIIGHLENLLLDRQPLVQSAALYIMAQLDRDRARELAVNLQAPTRHPLLAETARTLIAHNPADVLDLTTFAKLEKLVYLYNSDFFHRTHDETLILLADRAQIVTYPAQAIVTEEGDTCRELLLLVEGRAEVRVDLGDGSSHCELLTAGQTLDELEVLTHSQSQSKIATIDPNTRILAIPVDAFDDLLNLDRDFARRVLELESRQLQRLMRSIPN